MKKSDTNGYLYRGTGHRCKLCGKLVYAAERAEHLVRAHKLIGKKASEYFDSTDTTMPKGNGWLGRKMRNDYKKNAETKKCKNPDTLCGYKTDFTPFIRIIYTPMGNRK